MAYPRNAATPPIVTVGQVVQASDGAIQTSGASVRVKTGTGAWGAGAGTLACDATSGAWTYAPTQGETDAESFQVAVYKASCIGATIGVVTSALLDRLTSTRAGYLDSVLIAANANQRTVSVTGSNHVAADVHEFQTGVIDADALATDAVNEIADGVLGRSVSTIQSSAGEHSLATIVLAMLESSVSGSTWTIKRTDGSTTHLTKTVTTDPAADPITGVS